MPEVDASFDDAVAMSSSVSSGFLQSVLFLIILDPKLLITSNLINYVVRVELYFCLCPRQVKCQPPRRFITFPVIKLHLDCGLLGVLNTLNTSNKRTGQCLFRLSDWDWCHFSCHLRDRAVYFSYQICSS